MRSELEKHYTHCKVKGCIQGCSDDVSHYEDPPNGFVQRIAAADYDETRHFRVDNATGRDVLLISNDKCLIGQGPNKPKRCDCLFVEGHDVFFVEFKLPQVGRQENEESNRQESRLTEACQQLLASIQWFEQQGWIGPNQIIRAYAHVGYPNLMPDPTTTITNIEASINEQTKYYVEFNVRNDAQF